MAFTLPEGIPAGVRIIGARITADTGATSARWFVPYLNVPPGGTLTVTFTVEDMQAGW
jgi:hypothetical protein